MEAFKSLGGTIVETDVVKLFQPSYGPQVTKIRNLNPQPDVIMTSMFVPDSAVFVRELRAAGVKLPILLDDGNDTKLLFAGGAPVGDVTVATFGYPSSGSALERFYNRYQEKLGASPESNLAGLGGDVIAVVEQAVKKAGTTDPKAVRDALDQLDNVQTLIGAVSYRGFGRLQQRDFALVVPKSDQSGFDLAAKVFPDVVPKP